MLSFTAEWQDAPGVKDSVLAATWARLEIQATDGADKPRWPSRVISAAKGTVRRGLYGSVFPLADWIVENWWFLLNEPCRVPEMRGGRQLARDPSQRDWAQRHNLLAAREGASLPDLTIWRDGAEVAIKWVADPDDEDGRPVRFIERGEIRESPGPVEQSLQAFVEAVLERLDDHNDEEILRLRSNWQAVGQSRMSESDLCSRAAALGVDPYDESECSEEITALLQSPNLSDISTAVRGDLLEATTPAFLASDLDWLARALPYVRPEAAGANGACYSVPRRITAHALGYERARSLRQQNGLPPEPISDLGKLLQSACGWPPDHEINISGTTENLSALVGRDSEGKARVIGPRLGHWAQRFRLARSLYFLADPANEHVRLVTSAHTWDQRASRSFAAELLAPAEALRGKVQGTASIDHIDKLAHAFDVNPTVIERQLRNHRIAWVEGASWDDDGN